MADPLELGGDQAGKQGTNSSSRDKRLRNSCQPHVDVVRSPIEIQKILGQIRVVHHFSQLLQVSWF